MPLDTAFGLDIDIEVRKSSEVEPAWQPVSAETPTGPSLREYARKLRNLRKAGQVSVFTPAESREHLVSAINRAATLLEDSAKKPKGSST